MNFDPIFGEDNEIIGYTDNIGQEWSVSEAEDYFSHSGNAPVATPTFDWDDFPADFGDDPEVPTESNYNLGWGTIEGEIFNSQWD